MTVANTGAFYFPDHVRAALARLLEQDKGRVKLKALITVLMHRIQRMEDLLWTLHESMDLDTAVGDQLDILGGIVGEDRQGRTDPVYRLWVKARARANRSSGTPNDSLAILRLLVESDTAVSYRDQVTRDAEYILEVSGSSLDLLLLRQILDLARPAGVQMDMIADAGPDAFRFDIGPGFDIGLLANTV